MNKIIIVFILITFLNCKTKNEFEGAFLSAIEVTTLNSERINIDFNVGYTVEFKQTEKQDCIVETKEELNSIVIETTVRAVIRDYVRKLDDDGIAIMDKEEIKTSINKELREADISINAKNLVNCPFEVTMFVITRRK